MVSSEFPRSSLVKLSPEANEAQSPPDVIVHFAPQVAAIINKLWPQVTTHESGVTTHYVLAGSLGVALLAGSRELHDDSEASHVLPSSARSKLIEAVHLIHDIDHIRIVYPWPDSLDPQFDHLETEVIQLAAITSPKLSADALHPWVSESYLTVTTAYGSCIVTRPDSMAANRLLSVLFPNNFLHKPYQLNRETPSLVQAAILMYSEDAVWKLISDVFRGYESRQIDEYLKIGYLLPRALKDPCLSDELKALLTKASSISGTSSKET